MAIMWRENGEQGTLEKVWPDLTIANVGQNENSGAWFAVIWAEEKVKDFREGFGTMAEAQTWADNNRSK